MIGRSAPGNTRWAFSAGLIPAESTGHEPENTSRNVLCLLNPTDKDACARVTVFHEEKDPVGPYEVRLSASRVRHVRINDLIDPEAVPLGQPFGMVIECDVAIVVQVLYVDTSEGRYAVTTLPGVPG